MSLYLKTKKGTVHTLIAIEDLGDVVVFECNNVGLKKLSIVLSEQTSGVVL